MTWLDGQRTQSPAAHPSLAIFGAEGDPPPSTLCTLARAVMDRHPDAVALDCEGDQLTYRELLAILREQVARLHRLGIGRGARVGIRVPPGSMQVYLAALATIFAGAAYVPVGWDEDDDRARAIWDATRVHAVYGADLDLTILRPATGEPDTAPPGPDDDAWILFTGAADALEGVVTTHRSAAAVAAAQAGTYLRASPLGPGDRIMTRNNVDTLTSTRKMWLSWCTGATLVPAPCAVFNSHRGLFTWIAEQRITVVATAPSMASAWPRQTLDRVRLLVLLGQDTGVEVLERLHRPGMEIWTTYSDTVTSARLYDGLERSTPPESVGLPLPGTQLSVVDSAGGPVRWGEIGEVVAAGPAMGRYLDPVVDAETYPPLSSLGWERAHRTGTLVRAERGGLITVDAAGKPTRISAPPGKHRATRRWRWWPTR